MSKAKSNLVEFPSPPRAAPSLLPEYAIALLGVCPVLAPMLKLAGADMEPGWPVAIAGIAATGLAFVTSIRMEKWEIWAQVAIGLSLIVLACIGLTQAYVDSHDLVAENFLGHYLFGFLIAFLAAIQLKSFNVAVEYRNHRGWRGPSPVVGRGPQLVYSYEDHAVAAPSTRREPSHARGA